MDLKVYTEVAQLVELEPSWERLLTEASASNVFMTPQWLGAWWEYYGQGKKLLVLGVYDAGRLVGLAPLLIDEQRLGGIVLMRRLKFVGAGLSDRLDLILAKGHEAAALKVIVSYLFAQDWEVWDLVEVAEDSITAALLPDIVKQLGARVATSRQTSCPVIPLAADEAAFRSPSRKEFWKKVDYYGRRLNKDHAVELRLTDGGVNLDANLEAFFHIYRVGFADRPNVLLNTQFENFRRRVAYRMAERGGLLLALLFADGTPVSGQFCLRYGPICYAYNLCHDPAWARYSVGTVLQWEVLRHLIREGYGAYDFLRGEEPYKYRWGGVPLHHVRMRIWHTKAKARLLQAVARLRPGIGGENLRQQGQLPGSINT